MAGRQRDHRIEIELDDLGHFVGQPRHPQEEIAKGLHVRRRLSERLDGITHGPDGSIDKLLMTQVEQAVGHAALAIGNRSPVLDADDPGLKVYLYSRAQSVMGGTAQVQKNIIATRILGLPPS